jgi:hypothetical protein
METQQAWIAENEERERDRDQMVNALRLKLGLTQTSVCQLLVNKTEAELGAEARKRVGPPPMLALHSLTAKARAFGPNPIPPTPMSESERAGRRLASSGATPKRPPSPMPSQHHPLMTPMTRGPLPGSPTLFDQQCFEAGSLARHRRSSEMG